MSDGIDDQEKQARKKAIFDAMGKRGQQHVMKMGYDEWDPFQEPKDPRELLRSASALRAGRLIEQFYEAHAEDERVRAYHKDLLDLCRGLLRGESKAQSLLEFCLWFDRNRPR